MTRRSLLKALVALPLAPLVLRKPKGPGFTMRPGVHDSILVDIETPDFDVAALDREIRRQIQKMTYPKWVLPRQHSAVAKTETTAARIDSSIGTTRLLP